MAYKQMKPFAAPAMHQTIWQVPGTPITLVTDSRLSEDRIRANMRLDYLAIKRLSVNSLVYFWSDSPLATPGNRISGSTSHGRGYKLHQPQGCAIDLFEDVLMASSMPWIRLAG
jgi:hypothetical protein